MIGENEPLPPAQEPVTGEQVLTQGEPQGESETTDLTNRAVRESREGILPVLPEERTWQFFDYTLVAIGLAIATWVFLIGGTISQYTDLRDGALAIIAGNSVAVLLMALSTTIASQKYGVEQFTLLRSVFGSRGTLFPLFFAEIVWIGWTVVLMSMLGNVGLNIVRAFTPVSASAAPWIVTGFALSGMLFCWFVLLHGVRAILALNRFVAPGLVIIMLLMIYSILTTFSIGDLLDIAPLSHEKGDWAGFVIAFEMSLGAGFGWWAFMGSLARLTRTRRAGFWPNIIGLNLFAAIGSIIGLAAGLTYGDADPTVWMIPLAGVTVGVLILLFIAFGNITATVSTDYVACLGMKQMNRFQRMPWKRVVTLFMVPCVILLMFPDLVYANFGSLLALTGTLMSPLAGIYLADFLILRRGYVDLREIYDQSPSSRYYFWRGINPAAVAAALAGVTTYFFLFNPLTFASAALFDIMSASLPAMLVAMAVHIGGTKLVVLPSGKGGYRA
jgi:nucleobase:cation symporter-1, NCS1 family